MAEAERGGRRRLVVYSDFVCPFSWLTEHQLRRLRADEGVLVEHRAFELRPPGTPPLPAEDPDVAAVWESRLLPLARELGAELRWPALRPRTRKAHELAKLARERGAEDEARAALFSAVFAEGRDIGRVDVLVELGKGLGWDPADVKVPLDLDSWTEAVVSDEREAVESGVSGTPTIRAAGGTLVGLHGYEDLRELAHSAADEG